jgi:glutathione synthase/RimK-type ligase-like ATP-grasp enzyme
MTYIGILLDDSVYKGIPKGRTGYEKLSFYDKAAAPYGLKPCYFRLRDLSPDRSHFTCYIKNEKRNTYEQETISVPKVIHNRGLHFSKKAKDELQRLVEKGFIIFNEWNRYPKLETYELLINDPELKPNIPETMKATHESILDMIGRHGSVIIKPNSGSLGYGLMKIETRGNEKLLTVYSKKEKKWIEVTFKEEIPPILEKNLRGTRHIVQAFIPLAQYRESPFDLRISCQKNETGAWQMTGIAGKVAKKGRFITNVARGGKAYDLQTLLSDSMLCAEKVTKNLRQFSMKLCRKLEAHLSGIADIGLDIGITKEGKPMFIEVNGRDLRISFKHAKQEDIWKATYKTPIGYAYYLLRK